MNKLINEKKKTNESISISLIFAWICDIINGLDYLHSNKIIHRDIKPKYQNLILFLMFYLRIIYLLYRNVFLTKNNDIKLGDLGVGKTFSSDVTSLFTIVGTFKYMSPEMKNHQKYSYNTDVWSAGCILFELIFLDNYHDYNKKTNVTTQELNILEVFKTLLAK